MELYVCGVGKKKVQLKYHCVLFDLAIRYFVSKNTSISGITLHRWANHGTFFEEYFECNTCVFFDHCFLFNRTDQSNGRRNWISISQLVVFIVFFFWNAIAKGCLLAAITTTVVSSMSSVGHWKKNRWTSEKKEAKKFDSKLIIQVALFTHFTYISHCTLVCVYLVLYKSERAFFIWYRKSHTQKHTHIQTI